MCSVQGVQYTSTLASSNPGLLIAAILCTARPLTNGISEIISAALRLPVEYEFARPFRPQGSLEEALSLVLVAVVERSFEVV